MADKNSLVRPVVVKPHSVLTAIAVFCQKVFDPRRNKVSVFLKPEVARIKEMKLERFQITFVGMGAVRRKNGVVLTPYQDCRR